MQITITQKTKWSDNLFGITTTRPDGYRFEAGQWARLGIYDDDKSKIIWRAYSILSSPYDECLQFFSIQVPDGEFTGRLKHAKIGDILSLDPMPYGFLTLSRYQEPPPHTLWLIATGTGVAPFLSILQDSAVYERYQRAVLVYSARVDAQICYRELIDGIKDFAKSINPDFRFVFAPVVTGQASQITPLNARINALLDDGRLEQFVGFKIDSTAHIMLCGNPAMVESAKEQLKARGIAMNRRGVGSIAVENYW